MAASVKPEEIYISVLVHFFVHPPPVEHLRVPDRRSFARQLAVFLLRELKEPDSAVYPTLPELCAKLRERLGDHSESLVGCLSTTLRNLRCPHDIFRLFGLLEALLVRNADVRAPPQSGVVAGLDPLSPLGLFIRKLRVLFLGMSFEAVAQLATAIATQVTAAFMPGSCFATKPNPATAAAAAAGTSESQHHAAAAGGAGGGGDAAGVAGAAGGGGDVPGRSGGRALRDRSALEVFAARVLQRIEQQGPALPQSHLDSALAPLEAADDSAGVGGAGAGGGAQDSRPPLSRLLRMHSALQHRDYTAAQRLLHSYYYCMTPGPAGVARFPYALLNLSALHTALGHSSEARLALAVTLATAQQYADPTALLHALALQCRLMTDTAPGGPGLPPHGPAALRAAQAPHHVQLLRMLRRCRERGRELGQPALAAFGALAAARFALQHDVEPSDCGLHAPPGSLTAAPGPGRTGGGGEGEGGGGGELRSPALMVSAALFDTLALATSASLSAAAPIAPPTPAATDAPPGQPPRAPAAAADLYPNPPLFDRSLPLGAAAAAADAVQQMAGAAHLLQSAAWAVHGHDTLERMHAMSYLMTYSDPRVGCGASGRYEDRGTACAQVLTAAARRGPAAARAAAEACLAFLTTGALKDPSQDASTACYSGAAATPTAAQTAALDCDLGRSLAVWGGPSAAAAWLCAAHDRALAVGDLVGAGVLAGQLTELADPQPHRDMELRLEAARRGVMNLMAAGASAEAQQAATDLFARCADAGLQAPALRCLLLLAEIHLSAGDPHGALPHVLACLLPAQPGTAAPLTTTAATTATTANTWGVGPAPAPGAGAAGGPGASSAVGAGLLGAAGGLGVDMNGGNGAGVGVGGAGCLVGGGGGRSYDLLAAEALVLLGRVWHELADGGQLQEVLVPLQDALPLVLSHGSVHLQARTQLTIAELVLSETESPAALASCCPQLTRLLESAVRAAAVAEDHRLGALAAGLLAWVHEGLGDVEARDKAVGVMEGLAGAQAAAEEAAGSGMWADVGWERSRSVACFNSSRV